MPIVNPVGETLLRGIIGSKAHGFSTARSDTDRLGVYAAPTTEYFKNPRVAETTWKNPESDHTEHEAWKATHLISGCNPSMIELLWLPSELYEVRHRLGEELVEMRHSLLSAPLVKAAYLGYAKGQLGRIRVRGVPSDDEEIRKSAKNGRHLLRLLDQGLQLYTTGELTVKVEEPAMYFYQGLRLTLEPTYALHRIGETEAVFAKAATPLPEEPDVASLHEWLVKVRRYMLAC